MTVSTSKTATPKRTYMNSSACTPKSTVHMAATPHPTAKPNAGTIRRMGACLNSGASRATTHFLTM